MPPSLTPSAPISDATRPTARRVVRIATLLACVTLLLIGLIVNTRTVSCKCNFHEPQVVHTAPILISP